MKISDCEVCGNSELIPVLDLGIHPLCDDLIKIGDDRVCEEFPIQNEQIVNITLSKLFS